MTTFEKLSAINVNEHVEKKKDLSYLSWAWAWSEVKRACPDAIYKVGQTEYDDALGFMCHTNVTIEGETLEMWLPVMDGANKSMKKTAYTYSSRYGDKQVESATTFDINKTIMRCLVKNLAMFGLGLYIFAGEDLPEGEPEVVTKKPEVSALVELKKGDANWDNVIKYVTANKSLGLEKIGQQLNRKYKMTPTIKKEIANLINS
jgi:Protein of unknown function (DUF1071)